MHAGLKSAALAQVYSPAIFMASLQFDNDGKIKTASAESLTQADANGAAIIAFSSGNTASGRPYYAYVAVKPSKYREFCEKSEARETIKLSDYGRVVAHGFESAPPASVVQHMYEQYGFDETYESRLKAEISSQRQKDSLQKEEDRLMDIVAMMKAKQQQ